MIHRQAILFIFFTSHIVFSNSVIYSPKKSAVFSSSNHFYTEDRVYRVGRYLISSGELIDSYSIDSEIRNFDIDAMQHVIAIGGTNGHIYVFNVGSGRLMFKTKKLSSYIYDIAFSYDGTKFVVSTYDSGCLVIETPTGKVANRLFANDTMLSASLSPAGEMLAAIDMNHELFIVDLNTSTPVRVGIKAGNWVRYSIDGSTLASYREVSKNAVQLLSIQSEVLNVQESPVIQLEHGVSMLIWHGGGLTGDGLLCYSISGSTASGYTWDYQDLRSPPIRRWDIGGGGKNPITSDRELDYGVVTDVNYLTTGYNLRTNTITHRVQHEKQLIWEKVMIYITFNMPMAILLACVFTMSIIMLLVYSLRKRSRKKYEHQLG